MTEMFGEAWSPMSVPDLAPDDDDDDQAQQGYYSKREDSRDCAGELPCLYLELNTTN